MQSMFTLLVAGSFLIVKGDDNACKTICEPDLCTEYPPPCATGMELRPPNESCICCPLCIPYAEIGDFCNITIQEPGQINLRQKCRPPLICAKNVCLPLDYLDLS